MRSWGRSPRSSPPGHIAERRVTALIEANATDVLAYLERRVLPVEDAADVLSETLAVAWRRSDDLPDDDERARMWLFATARNVLANHRRGQRRADELTARLRSEIAAWQRVLAAEERDGNPLVEAVGAAIDQLPADQREVVTLVHWEGFTLAEVAQIVGVPASTVRGRYARARAELAHRLHGAPGARPPTPPTRLLARP